MLCSFGGGRRRLASASLAYRVQMLLEREHVERTQWQTGENRNSIVEHAVGVSEGKADFGLVPGRRCGVGQAPMRRHRLPRPHRAGLRCCIVTQREYEIELWRF